MLETIVTYILAGMEDKEIAMTIGCSPKYVLEVRARADYEEIVGRIKKREELQAKEEKINEGYVGLEQSIQKAMVEQLAFADFTELTRAMDSLIKRRAAPPVGMIINNNTQNNHHEVVMLQIPQAAVPEITLNSRREVVGIGDASLAPMDGFSVRKMFHNKALERKNRAPETITQSPEVVEEFAEHVKQAETVLERKLREAAEAKLLRRQKDYTQMTSKGEYPGHDI